MHDIDVRRELYARLLITHRRQLATTRFVDELGISGSARVDTAVLNGSFTGYEIKSERDTLARLPNQVRHYSSVLDYCVLVTTERHIEHADPLLPDWWGVIIASGDERRVTLRRARSPRLNPSIDRWELARLLWRDEVIKALDSRGLAAGVRGRPNAFLWDRLASSTNTRALRVVVRETLKSRSGWRSGGPPRSGAVA